MNFSILLDSAGARPYTNNSLLHPKSSFLACGDGGLAEGGRWRERTQNGRGMGGAGHSSPKNLRGKGCRMRGIGEYMHYF